MQKSIHISSSASNNIIQVSPGDRLAFTFSEGKADYVRDGANLVITAEEGGGIVLENFFMAGEGGELPTLVMSDGSEVAGGAFLTSINPAFDITTAAGPSSSAAQGSGVGSYDDASGDLLGGIDRFGSLGTDFWSRETSVPEQVYSAGLASSSTGGTGGDNPGGPSNPANYIARAVLYKTEAAASNEVRFRLLDANNEPVEASASPSFRIVPDNNYFSDPVRNADGTLTATLTTDGLTALAAAGGGNLYEYLTITVDGYEYRMQVVVNQSGDFNSADENTDSNNGNFSGHEWHSEDSGTGSGERYGDKGHNEVWLKSDEYLGQAFSGSFTGYGGNDTINITGAEDRGSGMEGGAQIDTGAGRDSVTVTGGLAGMYGGWGEHNSIANAEAVTITGGYWGISATGGAAVNSITNAEVVTITGGNAAALTTGMLASTGGMNEVSGVNGKVEVTGNARGMYAAGKDGSTGIASKNVIEYVKGNVEVTGKGGAGEDLSSILATKDGSNTIQRVEGDVYLAVSADSSRTARTMVYMDGGTNEISGVTGSVILEATNTAGTASAMSSFGGEGGNIIKDVGVDVILRVDGQVATPGTGSTAGTAGSNGMTSGSTISGVGRDVLLEISGGAMSANGRDEVTKITNVGGNVTLTNTALQSYSDSMNAHNSAGNKISNVKGDVRMDGKMYANAGNSTGQPGGINTISGIGNFDDPSAPGGNVSLAAMYAESLGSTNTITRVVHDVNLGNVPADGGEALNTYGMWAIGRGGTASNNISDIGGTVNVDAGVVGMFAYEWNGQNSIEDVAGNVNVIVRSSTPQEKVGLLTDRLGGGMWAYDGNAGNTISGVGGTVTVLAELSNRLTYGMGAKGTGVNEISTVDEGVGVSAKSLGAYDAYGMYAQSLGSENRIKGVAGGVEVSAESRVSAHGMYAASQGVNEISGVRDGMVGVTGTSSGSGSGRGMFAQNGGSENRIKDVDGNVEVTGASSGFSGYGMSAASGGVNAISGVGGDVRVTGAGASNKDTHGMHADGSGSKNSIREIAGTVTVTAETNTQESSAMWARDGGINEIVSATDGNVVLNGTYGMRAFKAAASGSENKITGFGGNVEINAVSYGMSAQSDNRNEISGIGGDVAVNVAQLADNSHAYGIYTVTSGSENIIQDIGGSVTLDVKSLASVRSAFGLSSASGGVSKITAVDGDVRVTAEAESAASTSKAYAMRATNADSEISAVGGNVTVAAAAVNEAWGMLAQNTTGKNIIKNVGGTVTVSAESDTKTAYALQATLGGQNTIDNSASDSALTLIIKVSKSTDYALHATDISSANTITGSSLNDRIDITGKVLGNNIINTGAGSDLVVLSGSVSGLVVDMGDGYDTLVLKAGSVGEFDTNYKTWLTKLLADGGHGIESIQVDGLTSLTDVPGWLTDLCRDNGVDFSLYGGEVDAAGAQDHPYEEDHSYLINVDGNEADGQTVVLNNGHDRVELTGSVGHGADVTFNTAAGNDYAQAKDADLGTGFTLDMGDGDDMLALSGSVNIASGATLSGGLGHDVLSLGGLSSLNGTDVSAGGAGLSLGSLGDILDGFEVLDMTGAGGSSLVIDIDSLVALGIDSADQPLFSSDDGFEVSNLHGDNVLLIKGDADDTVAFSSSDWGDTHKTVTADGTAYTVFSNGADEYILVQQLVSVAF